MTVKEIATLFVKLQTQIKMGIIDFLSGTLGLKRGHRTAKRKTVMIQKIAKCILCMWKVIFNQLVNNKIMA